MTKTLVAAALIATTLAGGAQAMPLPTLSVLLPSIDMPAPDTTLSTKGDKTGG